MSVFSSIYKNKNLITQLTKRDILVKYRGSMLGMIWSILNPLIMLIIYTIVFGEIFKSKWGNTENESTFIFGLTLFTGMIVYNLFSEVLSRSATIIQSNVNYVKKIIFPLEILVVVLMLTALFNGLISLIVLIIMNIFLGQALSWTILLIPVVLFPIILLSMGLAWFLAALGVFFKDTNYIVTLILQIVLFLSPVFYSIENVPDYLKGIYNFNPLGIVIQQMREIVLWGEMPNWIQWANITSISLVIFVGGYYFFTKLKGAFADVI
ncbi:sugar ABC transporter permease [Paenibacillus helianthi]|uniref:Transport permease protein n=1 Tax=Paenibacillus helianthi TaxID=1349432 RepID=A0ABX3EGZ0_9BACL|nr:ABC transporter permease [Paenibacillus helianthi]OKP77117.1 sugar ABC transporter permease [Paenibacillus helianthi]